MNLYASFVYYNSTYFCPSSTQWHSFIYWVTFNAYFSPLAQRAFAEATCRLKLHPWWCWNKVHSLPFECNTWICKADFRNKTWHKNYFYTLILINNCFKTKTYICDTDIGSDTTQTPHTGLTEMRTKVSCPQRNAEAWPSPHFKFHHTKFNF
jgi:hypothetical protein